MGKELEFDIYGVGLELECDEPEIRERIANDFSFFLVDRLRAPAELSIRVERRPPDYDALPPLRARFYTPDYIVYPAGGVTYIDYFGGAVSVYDRVRGAMEIHCTDLALLHDVVFRSVLARVSERLQARGMHRVHALAIEYEGEAALFAMPPGSGRTTLSMMFLRCGSPYRFLSEDSPVIDADCKVNPFPMRPAVEGERPAGIADQYVTQLERPEDDPRYLISLDAFEGSIAHHFAMPRHLFIGERTLGTDCAIRPIGFFEGLRKLWRDLRHGTGLYDEGELMLQSSERGRVERARLLLVRVRSAIALLRSCNVYIVSLGRDKHVNASRLMAFLQSRGFGRQAAARRTRGA